MRTRKTLTWRAHARAGAAVIARVGIECTCLHHRVRLSSLGALQCPVVRCVRAAADDPTCTRLCWPTTNQSMVCLLRVALADGHTHACRQTHACRRGMLSWARVQSLSQSGDHCRRGRSQALVHALRYNCALIPTHLNGDLCDAYASTGARTTIQVRTPTQLHSRSHLPEV